MLAAADATTFQSPRARLVFQHVARCSTDAAQEVRAAARLAAFLACRRIDCSGTGTLRVDFATRLQSVAAKALLMDERGVVEQLDV